MGEKTKINNCGTDRVITRLRQKSSGLTVSFKFLNKKRSLVLAHYSNVIMISTYLSRETGIFFNLLLKLAPYWLPSPSRSLLANPRNFGGLEAKLTKTVIFVLRSRLDLPTTLPENMYALAKCNRVR